MKNAILVLLLTLCSQLMQSQNQEILPDLSQDKEVLFKDLLIAYDRYENLDAVDKEKGSKAYARWIEYNRERLNPGGVMADPSIFLKESIEISRKKESLSRAKTGLAWSPVGPFDKPGTFSSSPSYGMGRINCISFHPTEPDIYWIGVAQGGVWKTINGGESYMPLTDDLPLMRVSDIAVDPGNPDVIYISVCDYAYMGVALNTDGRKRHTHYGLGVYKTVDGGQNWNPTGLGFEQSTLDATMIRRVLISPENSDYLLAAGVSGIWKSSNGGSDWELIREEMIWDVEQDFTDGNVIYATPGYVQTLGLGQAGLLKSTDFGQSWTELNPGFPGDRSISRVEIGLTPESPDYVYLVAADLKGGFYGFYRSTDGGENWETRYSHTSQMNILAWSVQGSGTGGQGWYDLAILVDPKNKDRVFVGGINMWGTEDGGVTWKPCSYWVMYNGFTLHADHHQYKYNPVDQKYYACQDGGVARTSEIILGSASSNYNWPTVWEERSNGMAITSFYRLGLSEMNPGYLIAGAQDNSTFFKQNGEWVNIIGGDGMEAMIDPDNHNIIYGSSQYGSWSKSVDGGKSFRGIRPTNQENGGWTTPMVMDPNNPATIFAGYGNVWKSTNRGDNWTRISNFPEIQGYGKPAIISALSICPSDPGTIYVGKRIHHEYSSPSTLWKTHDGEHWVNVTAGLPDELYFTYLAIDNDDPMKVWVTCSGFLGANKVFHSSDGGENWENISWNLPNIPVNTIVHQNRTDNNILYIGTDAGVYYTWDNWDHWELHSTDLPNVIVSELEIHYPSQKLYAATFGRGIWMADLASATNGIDAIGSIETRLSVYPNPIVDGQVNIDISGMPAGLMTIDIIDIQGKIVFQEQVPASEGRFNGILNPDISPGVYFIRSWVGTTMRTTKLLFK